MNFLKRALKSVSTRYIPDGRPHIFLFSSPRSGSTWLMELIYTQPGFRWSNEPFNIRKDPIREHLNVNDWHELYDEGAEEKIRPYIEKITNGKLGDPRIAHTRHFSKDYRYLTHRVVFKILHAGEDRMNWFKETFNGRIVLLLRHPIPVSVSRENYPRLMTFINSDYRRFFTREQLDEAKKIAANGDKLQQGVLDWCLQNAVPLQHKTPDWAIVTYEQLVLEPSAVIQHLTEKLDFEHPEYIIKRLEIPSGSTTKSDAQTQSMLQNSQDANTKMWLVEKWRKKVTEEQERQVMSLLELFQIDVYKAGSALPKAPFWIESVAPETVAS